MNLLEPLLLNSFATMQFFLHALEFCFTWVWLRKEEPSLGGSLIFRQMGSMGYLFGSVKLWSQFRQPAQVWLGRNAGGSLGNLVAVGRWTEVLVCV